MLDHLDISTSDDTAKTETVARLVSALPLGLKRSPPQRRVFTNVPGPPKERLACLPPERAVLNVRPYAKTSGPRRVPVLASANGVPFLRLTKPQPPALSRVIRQRLERKQKLFDTKVYLENWYMPLCQQEDDWETLINAQLRKAEDRANWVDAIILANQENKESYDRDGAKDRKIIQKMQRIVDLETELALKEGQTIIRGRKRRPLQILKPEA